MTSNRQALLNFYAPNSVMSYERKTYVGIDQIASKIKSFTFGQIAYDFQEYDVQPSPVQSGIVIVLVGSIRMDQEMPMKFTQTFQVVPNQQGGFYISNDFFRFIMG